MPVFGYSQRVVNEHGLHEMREVTFDLPLEAIRRIAFLLHYADDVERGKELSSHRHFTEYDRDWG